MRSAPLGMMVLNCWSAPGGGSGPDQFAETTAPFWGATGLAGAGAWPCLLLAMFVVYDRSKSGTNTYDIAAQAVNIRARQVREGAP